MMTFLSIVKDTTEVYTSFGWTGILVLVVLTVGYFGIKKLFEKTKNSTADAINKSFIKMSESLSETLKDQNDKILDAFISQSEKNNETMRDVMMKALKTHSKEETINHVSSINRRLNISKYVQQKVNNLFYAFNCDRAFILEFHNSKQNLTGLSFVWYDMVYEAVAKGFYTLQNSYKDQEATQLIPIINDVNEGNGYVHYTIDELNALEKESTSLYHRLRIERQLQEAIILGLYASDNSMLGLLVLEYEDRFMPIEKVVDIEELIAEANAIATLLDCTNIEEDN